jgi:hypothetical protein
MKTLTTTLILSLELFLLLIEGFSIDALLIDQIFMCSMLLDRTKSIPLEVKQSQKSESIAVKNSELPKKAKLKKRSKNKPSPKTSEDTKALTKQDLQKLAKRKELQKRFNTTKILIIDEISMLSADFFDNLNLICQHFKENNLPFGGLQIILCGDLFQLPPISRGINPAKMVVHSSAWSQLKPIICYLKEQHRQNQTDDLSLILGRIRAGEISQQEVKILTTKISTQKEPGITQLFSHNADVDYINQIELDKLGTEQKTFFTQTEGKRALVETLLKSCLAPQELKLKLGAEVMFVKNDQSGMNMLRRWLLIEKIIQIGKIELEKKV